MRRLNSKSEEEPWIQSWKHMQDRHISRNTVTIDPVDNDFDDSCGIHVIYRYYTDGLCTLSICIECINVDTLS